MVLQWRTDDERVGWRSHLGRPVQTAWNDPAPRPEARTSHLIDTTMLYAPRSGGVKRYLLAKRAWFADHRPGVRHTLVVPGDVTRNNGRGTMTVAAVRLPLATDTAGPLRPAAGPITLCPCALT